MVKNSACRYWKFYPFTLQEIWLDYKNMHLPINLLLLMLRWKAVAKKSPQVHPKHLPYSWTTNPLPVKQLTKQESSAFEGRQNRRPTWEKKDWNCSYKHEWQKKMLTEVWVNIPLDVLKKIASHKPKRRWCETATTKQKSMWIGNLNL